MQILCLKKSHLIVVIKNAMWMLHGGAKVGWAWMRLDGSPVVVRYRALYHANNVTRMTRFTCEGRK